MKCQWLSALYRKGFCLVHSSGYSTVKGLAWASYDRWERLHGETGCSCEPGWLRSDSHGCCRGIRYWAKSFIAAGLDRALNCEGMWSWVLQRPLSLVQLGSPPRLWVKLPAVDNWLLQDVYIHQLASLKNSTQFILMCLLWKCACGFQRPASWVLRMELRSPGSGKKSFYPQRHLSSLRHYLKIFNFYLNIVATHNNGSHSFHTCT